MPRIDKPDKGKGSKSSKPGKPNPPKPLGRMVERVCEVYDAEFGKGATEGRYLPMCLSTAVPLWIWRYREWTPEMRQAEMDGIEASDFCMKMEYVLHRGPNKGDSADAFNLLAKCIALLSFAPGGIRAFGTHYRGNPEEKVLVPAW